ncbi:NAD(P)/FAD-dependent oxidoreductase [Carnobacterium pleistocenium]|uniref:NAD(P)/FAD-dependent oxidoreductase n=1 Tax=Carnobacterium pleistocenium TaxID=181073 RepID=UPI00055121A6|nr:NAD(P)/FAD-dependent oxidoreductase [Carnobacterium pleistocenium]
MTITKEVFDITIIGGGPVGMFAAFYSGMRNAKVKIIESLPQLGGQLSMLYPEKDIYDIAALPVIKGQELIDNLSIQISRFDPTICLEEEVIDVFKNDTGIFELTTKKSIHYSKAIIITAGNGAFQPRRLELDHAEDYEGKTLHYYVNNIEQFKDRTVAICGGGDSAVDWALALGPIAKKVYLIHRRNNFRALEHSVSLLEDSNVEVITPYIPVAIKGEHPQIQSVHLKEVRGENEKELEIDNFLINYGFTSSIGSMKKWGFAVTRNEIPVNTKMETTVPGIYAAGDICIYDGKIKLIATGFGEAPTAVNNAMSYINPDERVQPMHSTSLF